MLPAVCGTFVAGGGVADLPWLALATLFAWAMASHGLRAIGRVEDDRVAGIVSTAVRFGRQGAAALVLATYVAAAGIATTMGATGTLVGGALALYVLLPIMVLAPSRHDPTAQEAAARRAWRTFDGLNLIVGLWFGLLLLRHWHVIVASPWVAAIAGSAVAAGYMALNVVATRLATRRRGIPETFGSSADDIPSLTVVVPCGTDRDRLFDTVTALRDQTYADLTILVIADEVGDDAVGAAVAAVGHDGRVVTAPAAPPDWERDAWIRRIGADEAGTRPPPVHRRRHAPRPDRDADPRRAAAGPTAGPPVGHHPVRHVHAGRAGVRARLPDAPVRLRPDLALLDHRRAAGGPRLRL